MFEFLTPDAVVSCPCFEKCHRFSHSLLRFYLFTSLPLIFSFFRSCVNCYWWSQWPRGLRHGSVGAGLLGLWVRIPPGMDVC